MNSSEGGLLAFVKTPWITEELSKIRGLQNDAETKNILVGCHRSRNLIASNSPPWWINNLIKVYVLATLRQNHYWRIRSSTSRHDTTETVRTEGFGKASYGEFSETSPLSAGQILNSHQKEGSIDCLDGAIQSDYRFQSSSASRRKL